MKKLLALLLLVTTLVESNYVLAQDSKTTEGYKNGSLLIIGGGKSNNDIMQEFLKLSGGDLAKRFGYNHEAGAGFFYKSKKGWLYGVEGSFMFGNQIKGDK